jgi:hypothetical protein
MKTILIVTEDIIPGTKYMKDSHGRLDLLGQILFTGYGIKIHNQIETPAHQGTSIHPFTVTARERVHNTELTLRLLQNAEILSGRRQVEEANKLFIMRDVPITLERVEV